MYVRNILRFVFLLSITTGSFYFLAMAGKVSAERIQFHEEKSANRLISQTSNTEYIFFESITKFLVSTVVR